MGDELKQVQIMFEAIRGDIKSVAEGHSVIRREIQQTKGDLAQDVNIIKTIVKSHSEQLNAINTTVNEIKQDLKEHIHRTVPPAHVGV